MYSSHCSEFSFHSGGLAEELALCHYPFFVRARARPKVFGGDGFGPLKSRSYDIFRGGSRGGRLVLFQLGSARAGVEHGRLFQRLVGKWQPGNRDGRSSSRRASICRRESEEFIPSLPRETRETWASRPAKEKRPTGRRLRSLSLALPYANESSLLR